MVADVRENMRAAGFPYWPKWVEEENRGALSKLGAQNWLRHLFSLESIAASKPEPVGINGLTEAETSATASVMGLTRKQEPQAEPCPESNSDCKNRHQCWEPCGELGKSEAHVKVHVPQAQAGEPFPFCKVEDVFDNDSMLAQSGVKRGDLLITLQSHREAIAKAGSLMEMSLATIEAQREVIAKKDAALDACVEARDELLEALLIARDHIDMDALEISHCKDAERIRLTITKFNGATA